MLVSIVLGVAVVGCMFLWLVYCLVQSALHGPEKGVHVIKATGMYFPLRTKMPKVKLPRSFRKRDKSKRDNTKGG